MTFVPFECDKCGFTIYVETVHEVNAHTKAHELGYTFEMVKGEYGPLIKAIPPTREPEPEKGFQCAVCGEFRDTYKTELKPGRVYMVCGECRKL